MQPRFTSAPVVCSPALYNGRHGHHGFFFLKHVQVLNPTGAASRCRCWPEHGERRKLKRDRTDNNDAATIIFESTENIITTTIRARTTKSPNAL